jgi:hypothetical protein
MLAEAVSLYDVGDVHAFVQATIERFIRPTATRGRIVLASDEREELASEGIAIMYRLAADYKPRLEGYDHDGRFSGYAAMFLPRKLGDAWHRMHEEHQLVTEPDGKRRWHYRERAVSLEAMTAEDPDRHALLAAPQASGEEIEGWLRQALREDSERLIEMTLKVARARGRAAARGERLTDEQIAEQLHISVGQVRERNRHIDAMRDRPASVTLEQALRERNQAQVDLATGIGCLLAEGHTPADVAAVLELDPGIVRDCMLLIARVRSRIETFMSERRAA